MWKARLTRDQTRRNEQEGYNMRVRHPAESPLPAPLTEDSEHPSGARTERGVFRFQGGSSRGSGSARPQPPSTLTTSTRGHRPSSATR